MKNSSCIFAKQRNGEDAVLFEGNNPLPFFWLMLLGVEDIDLYRKKIAGISKNEASQADTSIGLDKLQALTRAADRRAYVKQYYTTCLPLFDDWILFLQVSDFSDMKIYIDLYEISSFYPSLSHFCESLLRALNCFDENKEAWYEETIAGTCGYEGRSHNKKRFSDVSKAYQELNRKDIYGRFDKKVYLQKKMSFNKKRLLVVLIFILLAALIAGVVLLMTFKFR